MKSLAIVLFFFALPAMTQEIHRNIPYVESGGERQQLDIYAPKDAKAAPVLFWIHGGGWEVGNKSEVDAKPAYLNGKRIILVLTGYRLLPDVTMDVLIRDVAKALAWTHRHIAEYGGDPTRIIVAGHSAGAQLAALVCTDERYLKEEGLDFTSLKGCVPVDGDTYDIPAMIEVAETRRRVHHEPLPTNGHRQKFMNDPAKHRDFSAVYHVAKDKGIPPFLIIHVSEQPDNSAQARRFGTVLRESGVPVTVHGQKGTNHTRINDELGLAGDPVTEALDVFLEQVLSK